MKIITFVMLLLSVVSVNHASVDNHWKGYSLTNTQVNNWNDRKVAVFACNSPIIVGAHAATVNDPGIPCTFTGFNEGVKAFTWIPQYNGIIIRDSEFTRNRRAIHCSNTCFHYINRNTISVGEPTGLQVLDEQEVVYVGIYQNGGAQFEIMENNITGFITAVPDNLDPVMPFSVGICVARTKTADDEIYRNFLNSLNYGNVANGDNGEGNAGLRYVCNENTNNHFDFVVSDNFMWLAEAQIANIQQDNAEGLGLADESAGNMYFSLADNNSLEFQNFWNEEGNSGVTYRSFDGNQLEVLSEYQNVTISPIFVANDCASETERTIELDGTINIVGYNQWFARHSSTMEDWQNAKYLYTLLIDGGNTAELQEQVEFAWTNNAWQMRNELLSKSPYLSLDVLYTIADKVETFPHAIALEIFLANPDILKDTRFLRYLETKIDPMPEYMINLLLSASDQSTIRGILEYNLCYARSTFVEASGQVLRTHLQNPYYDLANFSEDLKAIKTFATELMVIEEYLREGDITGANDYFNAIPNNIEYSVYDKREWAAYQLWLELRLKMIQDGLEFEALPSDQIVELTFIAETHWNSYAGRNSMEILNAFYDGQFDVEPMISSGNSSAKRTETYKGSMMSGLQVFPNPSINYFVVQLAIVAFYGKHELVVSDSNGKLIYKSVIQDSKQQVAIDAQHWANGAYQVSIVKDDQPIVTKTVHVVR